MLMLITLITIILLVLRLRRRGGEEGYADVPVDLTNQPIGMNVMNPNIDWNAGWLDDHNPARADVSYGFVVQDPFIRQQSTTIPTVYTNRHLTEKQLQSVDYVPRRIRPPTGPVGWNREQASESPLAKEMDEAGLSLASQWHMVTRLAMPSEFY